MRHPYARFAENWVASIAAAEDWDAAMASVNAILEAEPLTLNHIRVAWELSDPNPFPRFSLFRRTRVQERKP